MAYPRTLLTSGNSLGAFLRRVVKASLPVSAAAIASFGSACGGSGSNANVSDGSAGVGGGSGGSGGGSGGCPTMCCNLPPPKTEYVAYPGAFCSDAGAEGPDGGLAGASSMDAAADAEPCVVPGVGFDCYLCPQEPGYPAVSYCTIVASDAGEPLIECTYQALCGRRPSGLHRRRALSTNEVGAWFAQAAELEAASIDAFEVLAAELRAHNAPRRLVRRALSAARDEARHARMMSHFARLFGFIVLASLFWAANVAAQAPEHHAYLFEIAPGASYHVGRASYDGPVLAATPAGVVPGSYHSSFRALAPTLDLLAGFWPARSWAAGVHLGALGGAGFVARPNIPGAPAERLVVLTVGMFVRWHASPNGFVEGRIGATTMGIEGGVDEISAPGIIDDTDALTKGLWGPRGELSGGWNVVNNGGFEFGPRASFWGAHATSEHGALSLVGFHLGVGVGWM